MLKNIRPFRTTQKYTVIVDHPFDRATSEMDDIIYASEMHMVDTYKLIKNLGYRPRHLIAATKKNDISSRVVVRLHNDEEAAQLHELIVENSCEHSTVRIVAGRRVSEVHPNPLEQLA